MSRIDLLRILSQLTGSVAQSLGASEGEPPRANRGVLKLEMLERRAMLAGDVDLLSTDVDPTADPSNDPAAQSSVVPEGEVAAEGEPAPDLVQFAKNLDAAGVQFFGAAWCPACTQQKDLFDDGGDNLPFIEVTNPDRTPNNIAITEGITVYPTWRFPDDSEATGVLDLATISARSGVPIPQSEAPTFETVGAQDVRIGSPLHIPIDAYDPNGGTLTTTIQVDDPSLIEATVITGNRSLRLDMEGFDDLVFELFEQRAPRPAGRVADLAESGFYDGIIFHRVVNGFVIQAGDPTGTGTSGSNLGTFDDQFHPDLQHNRGGVLSFAKVTDDTNNSQFFITEVDTRFLDFNHSIFGQLVEGEDVREAISNVETNPGPPNGGPPTTPVRINNATVFTDNENSVIMLRAVGGTGTTNVTVTVTDEDGNTHSEVIPVTVIEDRDAQNVLIDSQPYLNDINDPIQGTAGQSVDIQLSSVDVEGDPVTYSASIPASQSSNASVSVTSAGLVTVTPLNGFTGSVDVDVAVRAQSNASGNDEQTIQVNFASGSIAAPTSLDLSSASDTGSSSTDNITNAASLTFTVSGVVSGNTVEIVNTSNNTVVGVGTATGSTVTITTNNIASLGDGEYVLAARQSDGSTTSGNSSTLTLNYDTTAPATVSGTALTQANVGRQYVTNLNSSEEGNGLIYRLTSQPSGATINATSGTIEWTPTQNQLGSNTFNLELEDAAGNIRTDSFNVNVSEAPLAGIRLEIVDQNGTVVNTVSAGDRFSLRMFGVDERSAFDRRGIFAAFADILFDPALVRVVPGSSITYSPSFATVQSGTFGNGIIDELGAAQANTVPTNERESLIATVEFEAIASGSTTFISEPAEDTGSETLLYLTDNQIPAGNIAFGNVSLGIDQNFALTVDSFQVNEDSSNNLLDVLANDTVASGQTLTLVSVTQPATGGSVSVSNGEVSFTPDPNFVGDVTFTYTASSGGVDDSTTVTVTVNNVNDPPLGAADTFTVDGGTVLNPLDVLANDSSAPDVGETLTVTAVSATAQGATVAVANNGQRVEYTPPSGFTGVDTFSYTLSDGTASTVVSVSVTVNPGDDPPTAVNDAFTVAEDSAQASFDVLANDTRDGDNQAFTIVDVQPGSQGGTASFTNGGTELLYEPADDFFGTETVRYTIRDSGGGSAVGTVTFTVTAVNDNPPAADVARDRTRAGGEVSIFRIADLGTNIDGNTETLRFSAVGTPTQGGSVRIGNGDNEIFYTPPSSTVTPSPNFVDTFTFTVTDSGGLSSTATLSVNVVDFVQRDILVDFVQFNGEAALGSALRLVGENELGDAVDVPAELISGQLGFNDLLPGEYRLMVPAIPFLQGGDEPREIPITSEIQEGDETVQVEFGRMRPEFLSIRDWLGSARRQSLIAVVSPGSQSIYTDPSSETGDVVEPEVRLNTDGTTLTINGVDDQAAAITSNVSAEPGRAVQLRGQVGDLRLYKISVDPRDVTFTASASTTSTQAEGEASVATATTEVSAGDVQAEGESPAAASTTVADVFVPEVRPTQTSGFRRFASSSPEETTPLVEPEGESTIISDASVDQSMQEVSPRLTLRSSTGDQIAETVGEQAVEPAVVDEAMRSLS